MVPGQRAPLQRGGTGPFKHRHLFEAQIARAINLYEHLNGNFDKSPKAECGVA